MRRKYEPVATRYRDGTAAETWYLSSLVELAEKFPDTEVYRLALQEIERRLREPAKVSEGHQFGYTSI